MDWKFKPLAGVAVSALLLISPGLAAAQTVQGMIISHEENKLVVRSAGVDSTIMLTPDTKVQAVVGLVGARREDHPPSDLIRGLQVEIDTVQAGDQIDAVKVTFKPGDLKTAMAIQAGIAQPKERIIAAQAENERRLSEHDRRFSEVGQFITKGQVRVLFATGSAAISSQGRDDLEAFASHAENTPGYLLRVVGHTDSTGSAAANQRLSDQRASAVTAYLLQHCKVPPIKMMSATGLGADVPIDENDTAGGKAQNRRVTVFLLVSKASQGLPASTTP